MSVIARLDDNGRIVLDPARVPAGECTINVACEGRVLRVLDETSVRRCSYWHDGSFRPARELTGTSVRIRLLTTGYTEVQVGFAHEGCANPGAWCACSNGLGCKSLDQCTAVWRKRDVCLQVQGNYALLVAGGGGEGPVLQLLQAGGSRVALVGVYTVFILYLLAVA